MTTQQTERGLWVPEWDLSDRLLKTLRATGMDPADMADYLEVHRNTVTNWTHGRRKPPASAVRLWAQQVGVPYEWLAHGIRPSECAIQDSNLEPTDPSRQPLNPPGTSEIAQFRKKLGHTGHFRTSIASR